ncbi:MAG: glutamine synthetase family protein, partial [Candidatus Aminicenantes bacterium]
MSSNTDAYPLSNPLCSLLDKPAEEFKRADLLKIIEQKTIERITFHYTALDGRLKELKLSISNRKQAETILAEGERLDGSSLFKGLMDTSVSDMYVVPEYKTAFFNPFDAGSLDFVCRYLNKDGERASFALDNILSRAAGFFLEKTGLSLNALGELEFFLISPNEPDVFHLERQQGYHESAPFIKSGEILNEMVKHIAQITSAVKYSHSEVGSIDRIESDLPGLRGKRAEQLEIEFMPKPVEEMADALILGRWIIRNVAYKYGCDATFAPKLEKGVAGNGFHFHLEILKDGKNIMRRVDGSLSEQALRLVGALCEYADSLTAFGNTVASSYMRLVPNQEAPTRIFWSDLNRNALIRVPLSWSNVAHLAKTINPQEDSEVSATQQGQTVELRSPDGSALVHLLLAGITMAAERGFQDDRSLGLAEKYYADEDILDDRQKLETFPLLPSSCVESSRILLNKRDLYERENIFPPGIICYVAKL